MRIAIFGTGIVGTTFAQKLQSLGHEVHLGTRDPEAALARTQPGNMGQPPFADWAKANPTIRIERFADAAKAGEVVFNCTAGMGSLEALRQAGAENLRGKVLVDVSNPLDFSKGMPPRLGICNDDSLGETIQRAFPDVKVVKSLNTMNCFVMVDPARVPGEHDVFVAGNDPAARTQVAGWLKEWFGWKAPIDLGDITAARGLEAWVILWVRLWGSIGTGDFNLKVQR